MPTLLLIALTFVSFVAPLSAITLSGTGQQASSPFNLQSGLAVFSMTHNGSSTFIIDLLDSQGQETELLVAKIGSFNGSKAVNVSSGVFVMDISADGEWSVTIENGASNQAEAQTILVFPQFISGEIGEVKNSTRIILRNNSDTPDTGKVEFRDNAGNLTEVSVGGIPVSTVPYSLASWAISEIMTDGTGQVTTGVIEVISERGFASVIEGTEIFNNLGTSVSVNNSPPRSTQQVYISVSDEENTGVAIYNPDDNESVVLDLILLDNEGQVTAQKQLILQSRQQLTAFADDQELFQEFFGNRNQEIFQGTLNINAQDEASVSVLGLLQKRADGSLIVISASPNAFKP